jgi:hypothetical protein
VRHSRRHRGRPRLRPARLPLRPWRHRLPRQCVHRDELLPDSGAGFRGPQALPGPQ